MAAPLGNYLNLRQFVLIIFVQCLLLSLLPVFRVLGVSSGQLVLLFVVNSTVTMRRLI